MNLKNNDWIRNKKTKKIAKAFEVNYASRNILQWYLPLTPNKIIGAIL